MWLVVVVVGGEEGGGEGRGTKIREVSLVGASLGRKRSIH